MKGQVYKFKYRANNIHGTGPYSAETSIQAASIPEPITQITTNNSGTNVLVTWPDSPDDHAAIIVSF